MGGQRGVVAFEGALACGLASALLGASAARYAAPGQLGPSVVAAGCCGFLGAAAGHYEARPGCNVSLAWLAIGGSMMAVPLVASVAAPFWACTSIFVAPLVGLLFATLWWSVLVSLHSVDAERVVDDADRARSVASLWTLGWAFTATTCALLLRDASLASFGGAVVALAGARALWAWRASRRRRAWADAVLRGEVPGWRAAPLDALGRSDLHQLLPALFAGGAIEHVLLEGTGSGPYREMDGGVPRYLVRRAPETGTPTSRSFPWAELGDASALVGSVLLPFLAVIVGLFGSQALAHHHGTQCPSEGTMVGLLLLISAPVAGALLFGASRLAQPKTRDYVYGAGLAVYLLGAPFACMLTAFAAFFCGY